MTRLATRIRLAAWLGYSRAPDGEEERVTCMEAENGQGFTPSNPCSRKRGIALFWGQSRLIYTIEVMLHSPRVITVASNLRTPTRPGPR